MLTSDQSIIRFQSGRAIPDRLTRVTHAHYLTHARRMLELYQRGVGQAHKELHRDVQAVLADEPDCDRRRIAAFCKLLDDAGEFESDAEGKCSALRLRVFAMAAASHPLVSEADGMFERTETETKSRIAAALERPWEQIEHDLYLDVLDAQPLRSFSGYETPAALLTAYNVGQLQAALYRASQMRIVVRADFAQVVRYAKLARLLIDILRTGEREYRIELSGPASVLEQTRRYGINFARFLPALLACEDWEMRASIATPWKTTAQLLLSHQDGYQSTWPAPAEFDSNVEEDFFRKWGDAPRDGWRLEREAGILQSQQHVFVPDFRLAHVDGREVFMEVVGFWTPEYLEKKRQTLRRFQDHRLLLALPEKSLKSPGAQASGAVAYKTAIKPEAVLAALRDL